MTRWNGSVRAAGGVALRMALMVGFGACAEVAAGDVDGGAVGSGGADVSADVGPAPDVVEDAGSGAGEADDAGAVPDGVGAEDGLDAEATGDAGSPSEDGGPVDDVPGFAYLVIEPPAVDFGTVAAGAIETVNVALENAGDKVLVLSSIAKEQGSELFGTNASQMQLAPGQKKTLKVTFYADALGVHEEALLLTSNAVNDAVSRIDLVGEVAEPQCEDSDGDLHGAGCAAGSDCNDSDPDIHVGAPERCNGLDDDCDGLYDEDFVALGTTCVAGFGACTVEGFKVCGDDLVSLQCSVNPVTGGSELCNEVDDDCDGATDEDFPSKGKLCTVGTGACKGFDKFICNEDGTALVCNVLPGEPSPELCLDGIDNDCDGVTDEGDLEVCGDGIDNDCDGETDESGGSWGEVFFARPWYGETVAIYPSNGDGTFADPIPLEFPGEHRYSLSAVGDFNGDKYFDLAVTEAKVVTETACAADSDCQAHMFCDPTSSLCTKRICSGHADCPSGQRCWSVCLPKCSLSNPGACPDGTTCIDHNYNGDATGNDTFCTEARGVYQAVSSCEGDAIALTPLFTWEPGDRAGPVVDVDGNGHLDFVGMQNWKNPKGFVWLNDGAGGFTRKNDAFDYTGLLSWSYALTRTAKDMNGDGFVDILARRFDSGGSPPTKLYLFLGEGDGDFLPPMLMSQNVPKPANLVTADDFDGDGDHDIVAGLDDDGQPGNVWMLLNRGATTGQSWVNAYGIFDLVPLYNSGGEKPGVGNGTSFDFNGDNRPDVLAAWTPEECGSYVWGCTQIGDPSNICFGGNCRKVAFIPNDTGGACLPGTTCVDGQCQAGCTPDCAGKSCGADGCGGTCGVCAGGQLCTALGQCVVDCVPDCAGKVCGDNGCGGSCGDCLNGQSCVGGACVDGCTPSCSGKSCGDDGCGGTCAVFGDPVIVEFSDNTSTFVAAPANVPPTMPAIAVIAEPPLVGPGETPPTVEGTPSNLGLWCTVTAPSYDLDPVTYRYRWFKDGDFQKDLGEVPVVPASATAEGEVWSCRVRATDGVEHSPEALTGVTVGPAVDLGVGP